MSTFANRSNHSAVMSESDHDDELEQNESVMHKVKDVVSKIFHPSFLFSASADSSRSKRKRTTSIENQGAEEKTAETASSNGHGTTSKSILQRRTVNDDEGQLTDDEDSSSRGNVLPTAEDRPDAEQLKKRRRTGNYQNLPSSNTNGNRSDEKHSPLNNSTNNVGTFSSRRILDYGTNHSTSVLPPASTDSDSIAEGNPSATSTVKTRFNIPSLNRGLNSSYDPSQSPLFSVTSRKPAETATTPARTTTNLKSTTNEFSANYLLASGLVQRSASTSSSVSSSTLTNPNSTHTQRLLSTERQMLGVNYASINSRRLPYIERLRRRTLQDCIRLNRTLDSEPLSISTIEEHTSAAASPVRKPTRTLEKDCGIQCNISNNDSLVEPSRKVQRTFPPPDIRNEALSVPNYDKGQSATTSQTESSIQTNSSISFEPIRPVQIDITKPKVLGNITSFSWPKFARAQEEFAKKHPEKCRADAISTTAAKSSVTSSTIEKPTQNATVSFAPTTTFGSAASKGPLFGTSPPRAPRPAAQPVWKCPSCSMEHPAQTSFCSVCKTRNTSYTRLTALEPTVTTTPTASTISKTVPDAVAEPPVVSAPSVVAAPITTSASPIATFTPTATTTAPAPAVSITFPITTPPNLAFPPLATAKETTAVSFAPPVSAMPSLLTSTPPSFFGTSAPLPTSTASSVSVPVTTKDNPVISFPVAVTSAPMFGSFGTSSATSSFGVSTTAAPPTTTSISNPFSLTPSTTTSTTNTFASFGTLPSSTSSASATTTTTTTSTPATGLSFGVTPSATTTAASTAPTFSFGAFNPTPATTASTSISTEKPPSFGFGASASAPSLTSIASGPLSTNATLATTTATPVSTTTTLAPNLFAFSGPAASLTTTSSIGNPAASTSGGFSFGAFPTTSSTSSAATNPVASSAPSLFGSSSGIGGFNFQPSTASATTTTSGSTPSGFGALSAVRPFAPAVISSGSSGPTSNAPAFGSTAAFGAPAASASSFSAFGATTSTPSFSFGSSTSTSTQGTATGAPSLSAGGFAFGAPAASSTAGPTTALPTIPTFGSTPASFNFGANPSLSFGSAAPPGGNAPFQFGGSAPPSNAPYQFGPLPGAVSAPSNPLAPAGFGAGGENNPFSVGEDSSGRRPVVKAKRRAKGN